VGALLEAHAIHPGRSAYNHLLCLAQSNALPRTRVDAVLQQVGLSDAAGTRVGAFSLGMGQRLGIAAALLGDPEVLLFDEPVNGLDLDGVRWIRALLRGFADEGRTELVSSHLMSEMQLIADRVVIIGGGRLIADSDIGDVLHGLGGQRVLVRTPQADDLLRVLAERASVARTAADELEVTGLEAPEVGDLAHAMGVPLHHLAEVEDSLEQAYLSLTDDSVDYRGAVPEPVPDGAAR
jgi:ABC-2 type transport system ATP-binding protein